MIRSSGAISNLQPPKVASAITRNPGAMTGDPTFKQGMLDVLPNLRAFARSLERNVSRADDLVQETLLKAWDKQDSFAPGTNLKAWLYTILRNTFYSAIRMARREVDDPDGRYQATLISLPAQIAHLEAQEFHVVFRKLSPAQREALILVGAFGLTYEEAAHVCECAIGTVKSRVSRARKRLHDLMA